MHRYTINRRPPRHQVFLGDCNELLKNCKSGSFSLCITDPPYGVGYEPIPEIRGRYTNGFNPNNGQILGDSYINTVWLKELYRVLSTGSALYLFCHWKTYGLFLEACESYGFHVRDMIVLVKGHHGTGNLNSFGPKHQLILFAEKGKHHLRFRGRPSNVWKVKSNHNTHHQNKKPLEWIKPLLTYSYNGGIVLDPFCGSGSTLVCCKKYKISCVGFEKDVKTYEYARARVSEYPLGRYKLKQSSKANNRPKSKRKPIRIGTKINGKLW